MSPLEMSYRVRDGDKFEAVYLLANHTGESLTYRIVCLVDYQQQIFTANDQTSNVHKVSLLPGEQKIFNLAITPLKQGTHDFVLLAVRDGVKEKAAFSLLSNRVNLFVGSGGFSFVEYSKVKTAPLSSNPGDTVIFNQTISPEDFSSALPDLERGAEYFLHIGNAHEQSTKYAVIIFADFEQPSPSIRNSLEVHYITLAGKTAGVIPWVRPDKHDNQVFAIVVENPYQLMEPEPEIITKNPASIYLSNALIKIVN